MLVSDRPASPSSCSIRTGRGGTACSSVAASRRSSAPKGSGARWARMRFRRRSPRATHERPPQPRPTGPASLRSSTPSRSSPPPIGRGHVLTLLTLTLHDRIRSILLDQDRTRWDRLLIRRGLAALERAERLGGAMGPYALQAAIAACHARATTAAETDWPRIVALYDAVAELAPSPVVELNRAVAVGMAFGPAAGLDLVDALVDEPTLKSYHLLPAVRGDLLRKLGRSEEARAEFERAAALT